MIGATDRIWKLGHVYDLTKYFDDKVKVGDIWMPDKNIYEHGYFVCHDVWDTHVYRIQVGINSEYEEEPRTKIIETYNVRHDDLLEFCIEKYELNDGLREFDEREVIEVLIAQIGLKKLLKAVVECDLDNGFENWDVDKFRYDTPLESLIERIDGGYGITKIELDIEDQTGGQDYEDSRRIKRVY